MWWLSGTCGAGSLPKLLSHARVGAVALVFSRSSEGDVPGFRFLTPSGEGVVDRHWPGLYDPWDVDPEENPFFRFGVNNNNQEEMAIYQGFAWAMTEGQARLAVLHYEGHLAQTWFGRTPESWVRWEYFVDPQSPDIARREEGFRRARSSGPPLESRRPEGADSTGAAAYQIESRDELRDLIVASLSDAWGELTLFGFKNEERLAAAVKRMDARTSRSWRTCSRVGIE